TGDLGPVTVLQDDPGSTDDEGRAMLEIVHDLAPGAQLYYHTAFLGPQNFAQGILDLKAAGAKVITDDVGYVISPFFNDGILSKAVDTVFSQGAVYTSA